MLSELRDKIADKKRILQYLQAFDKIGQTDANATERVFDLQTDALE